MKNTLFTICLLLLFFNVNAQIDTINAANHQLLTQNLKSGTATYLVYTADSLQTKRTIGGLWRRTTTLKTLNDQAVVEFTWKSVFGDTLSSTITNICDAKTLAPIYHHANYKNRGISAYAYKNGYLIPSDTVKNNLALKKDKIELTIPVLSWEQDLETYPLLPIKSVGQKFDISFYDPTGKTPTYHRYEVIGKEDLALNGETKVKCWLLKAFYSKDNWSVFWLTDKNKEVIKMREYYKGRYHFLLKQY